jgi:hypothetical protein
MHFSPGRSTPLPAAGCSPRFTDLLRESQVMYVAGHVARRIKMAPAPAVAAADETTVGAKSRGRRIVKAGAGARLFVRGRAR